MTFHFFTLAILIFSPACDHQNTNKKANDNSLSQEVAAKIEKAAISHEDFNNLLQKHVSAEGIVNYKDFKADEKTLDKYLKSLSVEIPGNSWTRESSLAYWINTYNAFTIKLILKNYPIKSITDLDGGKPWDVAWIELGGKKYSLNNIENDIIRPQFKDARIHFALNCAAKSCPPLHNVAFTSSNINLLFESRAKHFINSSANEIKTDSVKISKLFDWYKEDFGNPITFLNKYSSISINSGAKIGYQNYDWSLNGK
ncbi:MAG: DUF547 domain-containing protein [Ferruginibacter sp.]